MVAKNTRIKNRPWLRLSPLVLALLCLLLPVVNGTKVRSGKGYSRFPLVRGELGNCEWAKSPTGFQLMTGDDAAWQMIAAAACIVVGILLGLVPGKGGKLTSALAGVIALAFIYLGLAPVACNLSSFARKPNGVSSYSLSSMWYGFFLCSVFLIAGVAISGYQSMQQSARATNSKRGQTQGQTLVAPVRKKQAPPITQGESLATLSWRSRNPRQKFPDPVVCHEQRQATQGVIQWGR